MNKVFFRFITFSLVILLPLISSAASETAEHNVMETYAGVMRPIVLFVYGMGILAVMGWLLECLLFILAMKKKIKWKQFMFSSLFLLPFSLVLTMAFEYITKENGSIEKSKIEITEQVR